MVHNESVSTENNRLGSSIWKCFFTAFAHSVKPSSALYHDHQSTSGKLQSALRCRKFFPFFSNLLAFGRSLLLAWEYGVAGWLRFAAGGTLSVIVEGHIILLRAICLQLHTRPLPCARQLHTRSVIEAAVTLQARGILGERALSVVECAVVTAAWLTQSAYFPKTWDCARTVCSDAFGCCVSSALIASGLLGSEILVRERRPCTGLANLEASHALI